MIAYSTVRMAFIAMLLVTPSAQSQSEAVTYPVLIAVPLTFSYTGDVVIIRNTRGAGDMILVRNTNVPAARLAQAVAALTGLRRQQGDVPSTDLIVRVRTGQPPAVLLAQAENWSMLLATASAATLPDVDGLGDVRYVRLFLPAQSSP